MPRSSKKYPTIYIIAYVEDRGVKRVIIDEGSIINVVSIAVLKNLSIPMSCLSSPTLAIVSFNNTLSTKLGVVMIPFNIGVRSIPTPYHVVKGEM